MYQDGYTPLIHAASNGLLPVVEYLVERGADIDVTDTNVMSTVIQHRKSLCIFTYQHGNTPLSFATMLGRLPVVEYLLERGADIEAQCTVRDIIITHVKYEYV